MVQMHLEGKSGDSSVNVLHLSDLHFGVENKKPEKARVVYNQRKELFSQLIKTLQDPDKVPQEWKPDIIVISGDIAYTASDSEYKQFEEELLPALYDLLDQDVDENRIIICPGNHDIIRKNVHDEEDKPLPRPGRGAIAIPGNVSELTLTFATDPVHGEWHHFESFVKHCCSSHDKLCQTVTFRRWPWLHFLVLNSAWDCRDDDDEGRLRVGYNIAQELYFNTERVNDKDIFVAVFHHPMFHIKDRKKTGEEIDRIWLHFSECYPPSDAGMPNFSSFIARNINFVLNGHIHFKMRPLRLEKTFHFINGTVHSDDTYTYHCRIIKISRTQPPKYLDLSRKLCEENEEWDVTAPNDPTEYSRNPWEAKKDIEESPLYDKISSLIDSNSLSLQDKFQLIRNLAALSNVLCSVSIVEYTYIYESHEKEEALVRILKP